MKTKLLHLLFLMPICLSGQSINQFFSLPSTQYAVVTTSTTLDQSAKGENVNWVFNNLIASGTTSTDAYKDISPSDPEAIAFPFTNILLTTTDTSTEEIKLYALEAANVVDVTGLEQMDLTLQYSDLGFVGTFPYAYNTSNNGNSISGNFAYSGVSGTFTGTMTTTVDAYGALSMNDVGGGAYSGTVTRLELIQQVELFVGIKVGDLTQTSYHYYDNSSGDLVFRTTNVEVTSGIIGNQSFTIMESLIMSPLSTDSFDSQTLAGFRLKMNPVGNELSFYLNESLKVHEVLIYDIQGRLVLKRPATHTIQVNQLKSGWYHIALRTDQGVLSKTFIKK
ncbi:T9SS type A sorting domain-containing protein [Cognatitamlana onchidii]|uniref:T9SS type A sorting domain-containing protein n=1 Tax=Cognatitamlana onchidii TaxID=2562860 RepID=UPI0010A6609A|nr:T9SS type A sorting domain-containing protein [Algibacter onchidii]